jgi:hypothetical protein
MNLQPNDDFHLVGSLFFYAIVPGIDGISSWKTIGYLYWTIMGVAD